MDKLILKMPKFAVQQFVNEHFEEISENDFWEIVNLDIDIPWHKFHLNFSLRESKMVLKYVIENNIKMVNLFNPSLFDEEILEMLDKSEFVTSVEEIRNNHYLENPKLRNIIIRKYPSLTKYLTNNQIDFELIKLLENIEYILTEDDILMREALFSSDKLVTLAIIHNPSILFKLPIIKDQYVATAFNNGLEITYEQLLEYPQLRNCRNLVKAVVNNDIRAVRFLKQYDLDYELCKQATNKGLILTEQDLLDNRDLCAIPSLMETAIANDPKLIKYVTKFCAMQISAEIIDKALKNYTLTEEDLLMNPQLCQVYEIMSKCPNYRLYSVFVSEEEKIDAVKEILRVHDFEQLKNLPFFKKEFKAQISGDIAQSIAEILVKHINENDILEEKFYLHVLDSIVDGIIHLRYTKNKMYSKYPDIVTLNNDVINCFGAMKQNNSSDAINSFAKELQSFINLGLANELQIDYEYLCSRLNDLYESYLKNNHIHHHDATIFYNEVLNRHRNNYLSYEKMRTKKAIKLKLDLTQKKKNSILNGRKIDLVASTIANQQFNKIKSSREEINVLINEVESEIKVNKDLVKQGIIFNSDIFEIFKNCFFNKGRVDYLTISQVLKSESPEVLHYIFKKYEQIKIRLINRIALDDDKLEVNDLYKSKVGLNVNNFLIASNDLYLTNVAKLLLALNKLDAEDIIFNKEHIKEIKAIIPFVGMIKDFDIEVLCNIFKNYGRIKERIYGKTNDIRYASDSFAFSKFHDVISLAKGYSSASDIHISILTESVVDTIGFSDIQEYFNCYLKMQERYLGMIPNVNGEFKKYMYESGNYNDVERLLIGKYCVGSCVDLINYAGRDTFEEALIQMSGDVIILRNKHNNSFYARILLFRRGNVVQLARVYNNKGERVQMPDEFFLEVAKQILEQSNAVGDNIDYVFVTKPALDTNSQLPEYYDKRLTSSFPHADFIDYVGVAGTSSAVKDNPIEEGIKLSSLSNQKYPKNRKPINYDANENNLTRLRALRVALEKDPLIKSELERDFEPFYKNEYLKVISGEDWYLALKKDGELESVVLPSNDPRTLLELDMAKQNIMNYLSDYMNGVKR